MTSAQDDFDFRHVRLEVDLTDSQHKIISGVVTEIVASNVASLSQVVLNLINAMVVDTVQVDGASAPFTRPPDLLTISLPASLSFGQTTSIRIVYHGKPPQDGQGLVFDTHMGKSFIWSLSEAELARRWWPCKDRPDDKADSSLVILTVPVGWTATSNGLLVSKLPGRTGTDVFTWRESYPITTYLICATAGVFQRLDDVYQVPGGGTMPVAHYVFPEQVNAAQTDLGIAAAAIGVFVDRFGPYPFLNEKYGVTVFGWDGGMEHQTNTSFGWSLITGHRTYDWLFAHELSHQWWGDNVTCATWSDLWLNEGFASWCEAVWSEHWGDATDYKNYMTNTLYVSDPSGPVYNYSNFADGNTVYNKGAWVLHMLRGVLGDDVFFPAMAGYRASYQGRSATTLQFRTAMELMSRRDLGWFFDEWVYGVNRPQYVVSTLTETHAGGQRVYIHLDQSQTNAPFFTMPVRIRVVGGTTQDLVLWNDPDHRDLVADVASTPVSVTVDPDDWILRTVLVGPYHLNLITSELPPVPADSLVSDTLVARGGTPPYTWQSLDPLPFGITLDGATGVMSGSSSSPGNYVFRIQVRAGSQADSQKIAWTIRPQTTSVADGHRDAPPRLNVMPNPAGASVLFSLPDAIEGSARFTVFDLAGRAVGSSPSLERSAQSSRTWRWDGRDPGGRRLPAGVYVVRATSVTSGKAHDLTARVLLLGR
jgi:aminopeptidase N